MTLLLEETRNRSRHSRNQMSCHSLTCPWDARCRHDIRCVNWACCTLVTHVAAAEIPAVLRFQLRSCFGLCACRTQRNSNNCLLEEAATAAASYRSVASPARALGSLTSCNRDQHQLWLSGGTQASDGSRLECIILSRASRHPRIPYEQESDDEDRHE
jgi:hypothetical protein